MGDIADRHGVGAVSLGMGLEVHCRGDTEKDRTLLEEAQTKLREGGDGLFRWGGVGGPRQVLTLIREPTKPEPQERRLPLTFDGCWALLSPWTAC